MKIIVWVIVLIVGLAGCGSAPATGGASQVTVIVPQTVVAIQTVIVPQTVIVRQTVQVETTRLVEMTRSVTSTPQPAATAAARKLSQPSAGFGYTLMGAKVVDPCEPSTFYKAKAGTRAIGILIEIANVDGKTTSSNLLNGVLIDMDGYSYAADTLICAEQIDLIDLAPGMRIRGLIGFTVPSEAKPARIRYAIGGSSTQILEAGLNP